MLVLAACVGCGEAEPVRFAHDERLDGEAFAEKPAARAEVLKTIDATFGPSPAEIRLPDDLIDLMESPGSAVVQQDAAVAEAAGAPGGVSRPLSDGAALYARHCLHCHGLTGDGEGPTAAFLYPRPRDYRHGLFKFTSTESNQKPTRADLRRTLRHGIDGTSMPTFSAQLTDPEMEAVIDYVLYLSIRGESERALMEEAAYYPEEDFEDEAVVEEFGDYAADIVGSLVQKWDRARGGSAVVMPITPRVEATESSIERGRDLFLGIVPGVSLQCVGCHGPQALGNGSSWIDPETFDRHVFTYDPDDPEPIEHLRTIAEEAQKKWSDEWGDPLRPANLHRDIYKGGRRPIDLYWRIAVGIKGTGMPGHVSILSDPDDLWHLVNFVLALPHRPDLLRPDRLRSLGVAAIADGATQPTH